ncbi:hypothetical protein Y032_0174g452 [Ancylostoma ceylanicum]|uniref:Uncharacterized protein n=1 Tax=Ancylostoma ceylanicum TaxID=53326 RepID=A0A016SV40_9BILA|nr:hypothetical protein Y032_0174g452 [Ancylostoma ceylanicum]
MPVDRETTKSLKVLFERKEAKKNQAIRVVFAEQAQTCGRTIRRIIVSLLPGRTESDNAATGEPQGDREVPKT